MSNDQPGWTPPQQPPENPYGTPSGEQPTPPPPPPYGQPVPPQQPFGQPSYPPTSGQQPHPQQPLGQSAYGVMGRDPNARPGTVTAAAIITMILSGLCAVLFFGLTAVMAVAKEDFIDLVQDEARKQDQSFSRADVESVYGVIIGVMVVMAIWCLIALVLAIFVLRRSQVARILLVVSASIAGLLSLLAITSGASIVTLAGTIAVIVMLFAGGASDWFRNKHAVSGSPTHQPW
jgi:hypothetical protein